MPTILGFFRDGKKIRVLRSSSDRFSDGMLKTEYRSKIIPLKLKDNNRPWQLSIDYEHCPEILKHVFAKNQRFETSDKKESPFFVLMTPEVQEPAMCRTGVLLVEEGDDFEPVIVTIDKLDYVIELKGVGSPLGGYKAIHLRRQAGARSKAHIRLTGGQSWVSTRREFENLQINRRLYKTLSQPYSIRSLAKIEFSTADCPQLGLLARLTPSNLRASFTGNDDLPSFSLENTLFDMGRECGCLVEREIPSIHRNLNINNMVYVSRNNYVLTDWEECDPLTENHEALDTPDLMVPLGLDESEFETGFNSFFAGFGSVNGSVGKQIQDKNPNSFSKFNKIVFKSRIGAKTLKLRYENRFHPNGIKENIEFFRRYFPKSYFNSPVSQWVNNEGLPEVEKKLLRLKIYQSIGLEKAREFFDSPNESHELVKKIPDIFKLTKRRSIHLYSIQDLGEFVPVDTFETTFLLPPKSEEELQFQISRFETVIEQTKSLIQEGLCPVPSASELYNATIHPESIHVISLFLPYVFFLFFFFENESQAIAGAIDNIELFSKEQIPILHKHATAIVKLKSMLMEDPCAFHPFIMDNSICKNIEDLYKL